MRAHGLGREELRQAPLNVDALVWVCIVRAPELGEVFQHLVVHSAATARAEHHRQLRILVVDASEYLVDAKDMVDVEIALVLLVIWRVDVGNHTVAIPLEVCHVWVLCHDAIHDAEHIILYLRVADVKHQLVAIVISVTLRLHDDPVWMLLEKFALWVHHLRLNPNSEFHTSLLGVSYQSRYSLWQFALGGLPVAEACMVVLARILVGKPTVVEQEHIYAQVLGILHQLSKTLLVEVEASVLPVVQKGKAVFHTHVHLILASPVVQIS